MVLAHYLKSVSHGGVVADGHGIVDHAVLGPLDLAHLLHLHIDGHIFVYYSDTALTGNGYGQVGLSHRIHGGGHDRRVQGYLPGQFSGNIHFTRKDIGVCGYKKHVIERQSLDDRRIGINLHIPVSLFV